MGEDERKWAKMRGYNMLRNMCGNPLPYLSSTYVHSRHLIAGSIWATFAPYHLPNYDLSKHVVEIADGENVYSLFPTLENP